MLTVQFQPNWPYGERSVIESLAADGVYKSQFETGISNGGLTAFAGGDRWRWESRLFSGRYDDQPGASRPVYGVWNRRGDVYGGAIRFGSSYLRLKPETVERATFCFPDSAGHPADFGDRTVLHPSRSDGLGVRSSSTLAFAVRRRPSTRRTAAPTPSPWPNRSPRNSADRPENRTNRRTPPTMS